MSISNIKSRPQAAVARQEPRAFMLVAVDRRADGAVREVAIARRRVFIARRIAGIDMRIAVATSAYRGVALSLATTAAGASFWRVSLVHRDPDLGVELYSACDDRDVVAEWQAWASYFALPKLIERAAERFEIAETQLGAVMIGHGLKRRRRGAALSKRRPRIRLRRLAPPHRTLNCVKNEREIISYE